MMLLIVFAGVCDQAIRDFEYQLIMQSSVLIVFFFESKNFVFDNHLYIQVDEADELIKHFSPIFKVFRTVLN